MQNINSSAFTTLYWHEMTQNIEGSFHDSPASEILLLFYIYETDSLGFGWWDGTYFHTLNPQDLLDYDNSLASFKPENLRFAWSYLEDNVDNNDKLIAIPPTDISQKLDWKPLRLNAENLVDPHETLLIKMGDLIFLGCFDQADSAIWIENLCNFTDFTTQGISLSSQEDFKNIWFSKVEDGINNLRFTKFEEIENNLIKRFDSFLDDITREE